jgi:hypothetical protein
MFALNQKTNNRADLQPIAKDGWSTNIFRNASARLVAPAVIAAMFSALSPVSAEEEDAGENSTPSDYSQS